MEIELNKKTQATVKPDQTQIDRRLKMKESNKFGCHGRLSYIYKVQALLFWDMILVWGQGIKISWQSLCRAYRTFTTCIWSDVINSWTKPNRICDWTKPSSNTCTWIHYPLIKTQKYKIINWHHLYKPTKNIYYLVPTVHKLHTLYKEKTNADLQKQIQIIHFL